jgi:hypothetical protein
MAVEQSRDSTEQVIAGPQSALEALKAFKVSSCQIIAFLMFIY